METIISTSPQIIGAKTKKMDIYMSKDIGRLVLDRLQATKKEDVNKSLLTENQRNKIIGDSTHEQRRGKG